MDVRIVSILGFVCLPFAGQPALLSAQAQSPSGLLVFVETTVVGAEGGERPATFSGGRGLTVGEPNRTGFALLSDACGGRTGSNVAPGEQGGWVVVTTPLAIDEDAVTFRVRWTRHGPGGEADGDLTLTLKPGESVPLDIIPGSRTRSVQGQPCGVLAYGLRVSVGPWPIAQDDRRLTSTEFWLVQRLPSGQERSQQLTVRGQFHQPTRFYFDSIVDGDVTLDFHGEFTVSPADDQIALNLTTRSRVVQGGAMSTSIPDGRFMRARSVNSAVRLTSGEVVAIELPRLSENDAAAFANHAFSIRVRSQRIR